MTISLDLDWDRDPRAVCDRVREVRSRLKLVIKVKDDAAFLEKWVDYHSRMVGPESIIILDNRSTDERMADLYGRLDAATPVISFGGHHNKVHRVHEFTGFYDALRSSTEYYAFLDADEFLRWVEPNGRAVSGPAVVEQIAQSNLPVIPGLWTENVFGYEHRFKSSSVRGIGPTHGKPVIASTTAVEGLINHNFQLPDALYRDRIQFSCLILHMKNLSAEQRIRANMRKLVKTGTIQESASI